MSKKKENLARMQCTECKQVRNYTYRNKRKVKEKLEINKHCPACRKHTVHKEAKK